MAPIQIARTTNPLTELEFIEEFDKQDALKLLGSDFLSSTWHLGYATDLAKQLFQNEKKQIEDYVSMYDDELGGVPVKYLKKKTAWGRPYVSDSLGLTAFRKQVRNTFAVKYYDIDLKNAQVALLCQLCITNNVPVPEALSHYVCNREEVLQQTMTGLHVSRKEAKELFLRLVFYGTYNGFVLAMREEGKTGYPSKPPAFVASFMEGIRSIVSHFRKANPALQKHVYRVDVSKHQNKDGSFMGLYLQEYESIVVGDIVGFLNNSHPDLVATKLHSTYVNLVYEFDGIKLLKSNVDEFTGGLQAVISLMESFILRKFEISLEFEQKPITGGYDLSKLKPIEFEQKKLNKSRAEALIQEMKYFNQDSAVKLLTAKYSDTYVFMMPSKEWCCWDGKKWVFDDVRVFLSLCEEVQNHFAKYCVDTNTKTYPKLGKAWLEFQQRTSSFGWRSGVLKTAEKALAKYDMEFDLNVDLIGFDNGVFDINAWQFRPAEKADMMTKSCKYDFRFYDEAVGEDSETEKELMEKVFAKIFPDPECRRLFFVIAASGISGRAIEHFFILNGSGRNGKGLCNQALEMCYGEYFYHASYAILTEDPKKKTSGDANPDLANVDKARLIIMREPPKDSPINNNVVKDLTGGGTAKARRLYKDKCDVQLHGTFGMETNERPPLREEATTADVERFVDLLYGSTFTSNPMKVDESKHVYPLDPTLKERTWWKDRRICLMNMLLRHLKMLKDENYKMSKFIPASVRRRSLEYLQSSFMPHRIFAQLFEKKDDDKVYLPDKDMFLTHIVQFITSSKQWYALPMSVRAKPEHSERSIRTWFINSDVYGESLYKYGNDLMLRDYREIPIDNGTVDDEETSEESFEISDN